ncbi:MAG: hypothetical protein RR049_03875 [Angelakisella sp.]
MVTESVVVILLTLIISYMYMRRGKRGIAMAVLPLAVMPFANLIGHFISTSFGDALLSAKQWQVMFLMIGLIAGGSLFGIISSNIKKRSSRRMYLFVCGGFTVLFAFAGMVEYLNIL